VDPGRDEAGWTPHRDSYADSDVLFADGSPQKLSVWLPLTDATTLNGCMYILPADRDPSYGNISHTNTGSSTDTDTGTTTSISSNNNNNNIDIIDEGGQHWSTFIQDFRALPAAAQSVLMWNFRVYHYGAHSSTRATHPRYSVGVEFTHEEAEIFKDNPHRLNKGTYDPLTVPGFQERLWLVAKQVQQFSQRGAIAKDVLAFATGVLDRQKQKQQASAAAAKGSSGEL
jgi:ectoine hydroxylase-related dioxygenase (phytanoyl-CoA dioxygenase family)